MVEPYSPNTEIKIYAGIGVICLQWSLLEMHLLRIIACTENAPIDKVFTAFAGLDMMPRINMAMRLARYAKWPQHLIKRIEAIRSDLQGKSGRNGLADKRNQVVHGVHGPSDQPNSVTLTMARWDGPKRTQHVSVSDIHLLAVKFSELAQEAWSIADAYGTWKFGPNRQGNSNEQFTKAKSSVWLEITKNAQSAVKRIFGNY